MGAGCSGTTKTGRYDQILSGSEVLAKECESCLRTPKANERAKGNLQNKLGMYRK